MKTKRWAIVLIIACTVFISIAQLLYKLGSKSLSFSLDGILFNYLLLGGLFMYGIGAIMMILALKGGEVSVIYPILGTSYVWVVILSWQFLGETINIFKIIGIGMIIAGVTFIGRGSK
ncbi:EamA family transporter [Candidatus Woesearchaeota archaeon]|nr:EamA family transporter [Candidatus Woesearchaeota archaeon]